MWKVLRELMGKESPDGVDWRGKYLKLKEKHEGLCEYVKQYHQNEDEIIQDAIQSLEHLKKQKSEFGERMLNHEENLSKLGM